MKKIDKKCLVVLSGGQDSITCLGLALKVYTEVEAISFVYGQRHEVELACAARICMHYGVPQKVVDLSFIGNVVRSALLGDGEVGQPHEYKPNLPSSFVPNRNALFLTTAHAYAQGIKAPVVMTGVCQTDYSGYPDCRSEFVLQLEMALNTGYQTQIKFETPLMWLNKAETFELAEAVGFIGEVLENSHTCYNGMHAEKDRKEWGYGCGACPSCELRAKGWDMYRLHKVSGADRSAVVTQAMGSLYYS